MRKLKVLRKFYSVMMTRITRLEGQEDGWRGGAGRGSHDNCVYSHFTSTVYYSSLSSTNETNCEKKMSTWGGGVRWDREWDEMKVGWE